MLHFNYVVAVALIHATGSALHFTAAPRSAASMYWTCITYLCHIGVVLALRQQAAAMKVQDSPAAAVPKQQRFASYGGDVPRLEMAEPATTCYIASHS